MAKIDWALSDDGDLVLGDPRTDEEGNVLYRLPNGILSPEKGLYGKEARDIDWVEDLDAEKQIILNRLRTDMPDWYHHPNMGGNLTDLIGEPNTRQTAALGVKHIIEALTYKNLYNAIQLNIRPVPVSESELLFMIEITKFNTDTVRLPLVFDLTSGILNIYEAPTEG